MRTKIFAAAILAASLMAGSAMAQTQGSTPPGANLDKTKMAPFYTDETMKTVKPMEDFKAAFMAMNKEDQASLRKDCENSESQKDSFCMSLKDIKDQ